MCGGVLNIKGLMLVNQIHPGKQGAGKMKLHHRASVSSSDLKPSDCSRAAKVTRFLYVRKYSISPCTVFTFCLFVRFLTNGLWKTESLIFTISLLPKPETDFCIHKLFSLIFFSAYILSKTEEKERKQSP